MVQTRIIQGVKNSYCPGDTVTVKTELTDNKGGETIVFQVLNHSNDKLTEQEITLGSGEVKTITSSVQIADDYGGENASVVSLGYRKP